MNFNGLATINVYREEIIGRIDINHIISEFASGNDKKIKVICIIT